MRKLLCFALCAVLLLAAGTVFAENSTMTRVEALRLIAGEVIADYDCPFTDVEKEDKALVGYAFERGWIKGTGNTLFSPDDVITRECFLTMILRSLKYTDPLSFTWDNPYDRAFIAGIYPVKHEGAFTIDEAIDIIEKRKNAYSINSIGKESSSYAENLSYVSSQTGKLEHLFDLEDCTIVIGYITGTPHGSAPRGSIVFKSDGEVMDLILPRISPWKRAMCEEVYLSEDNTKLYYTCTIEKDYIGMDGISVVQEAGVYSYTVDLNSRETSVAERLQLPD